jgi:hypothetical protein
MPLSLLSFLILIASESLATVEAVEIAEAERENGSLSFLGLQVIVAVGEDTFLDFLYSIAFLTASIILIGCTILCAVSGILRTQCGRRGSGPRETTCNSPAAQRLALVARH